MGDMPGPNSPSGIGVAWNKLEAKNKHREYIFGFTSVNQWKHATFYRALRVKLAKWARCDKRTDNNHLVITIYDVPDDATLTGPSQCAFLRDKATAIAMFPCDTHLKHLRRIMK